MILQPDSDVFSSRPFPRLQARVGLSWVLVDYQVCSVKCGPTTAWLNYTGRSATISVSDGPNSPSVGNGWAFQAKRGAK